MNVSSNSPITASTTHSMALHYSPGNKAMLAAANFAGNASAAAASAAAAGKLTCFFASALIPFDKAL